MRSQQKVIGVPLLATAIVLSYAGSSPGEQVLILGDSLSKEYAIEWLLEGYDDLDSIRSWSEILDDRRNDFFDFGPDVAAVPHPSNPLLPGHRYNWGLPGGKITDFVDIVRGSSLAERVARSLLEGYLEDDVERVVIFVGGNDADSVYATAYNTGDISAFTAQFLSDTEEVVDWVLDQNSSLQVVLVNVPHVGATPKVKRENPPDPVLTANATFTFTRLNAGLAQLAEQKDIGYADVFSFTLDLLGPGPFCIQGIPFSNTGTDSGSLDFIWLSGQFAQDFHPNTNGQALVANAIIDAFNDRYGAIIAPLTTEEILEGLLGKDADVSFQDWLSCFGVSGGAGDDPDGDGMVSLIEFGLGTNPVVADRGLRFQSGGVEPGLVFRPRLSGGSSVVDLSVQRSVDLVDWEDVPRGELVANPDGTFRVPSIPGGNDRSFLRLRSRLLP